MKRTFLFFPFVVFTIALNANKMPMLRPGVWRGLLQLNDSTELPLRFTIALDKRFSLVIWNCQEKIVVEDLIVTRDSVNWRMPVFDSWFKCKRESDSTFSGTWYNNSASKPYTLKFNATYGRPRFDYQADLITTVPPQKLLPGKWECTFSPGKPDSSKAIGLYNVYGAELVCGTFLTESGDYRFLEGGFIGFSEIALSCFDGQHAFLFIAMKKQDGTLEGDFWSGKFGHEKWVAKQNENFQLRDPEKLTWVRDSSNVNFTFKDLNGKPVSLNDSQFKGKVVIIQLMGTWCPNCMDETAWLSEVYKKYRPKGLEIIALAYERSADTGKSNPNIRRLVKRYDAEYTFLNTGKSGRDSASASLPLLNGIMAFPTTIYFDKTGKVRKVYTGFNGPATGAQYQKDTEEAERFIMQLLAE